jgi:hypothetical protein
MTDTAHPNTAKKKLRIQIFADFFKSYMSVSSVVAASVPIPVASFNLLPIYAEQKSFLTVYSSMLCFLILAFIFSIRHRLSRWMFTRCAFTPYLAALPLIFILLAIACILAYHACLQRSFESLHERGVLASARTLLNKTDFSEIPDSLPLAASYLGIFIFAEIAFVLMAVREYLEDVLGLDEIRLLHGEAGFADPTGRQPPTGPIRTIPSSAIEHSSNKPQHGSA